MRFKLAARCWEQRTLDVLDYGNVNESLENILQYSDRWDSVNK